MLARILFPLFLVACSASNTSGSPPQDGKTTQENDEEEDTPDAGTKDGNHGTGTGGGKDASSDVAVTPAPTDGGKAAFGAACNDNTQCETGLCFNFNSKGKRCSKSCTVDTDCPSPPGLGCSGNQKVCRVP